MSNIVKYEAKDGQSVELTIDSIKKFLVSGKPELVTTQEMVYFMGICQSRGMNPFAKDCYLMKYGNEPAAIITSIDFFRSRAKAQSDCKGWQSGIIVEDKDGNVKHSNGLIRKGETLLGGWFKATPEGWETEFVLEVNLDGYIKKTKSGQVTAFWQKEKQPTMIRKVAESQGLREIWPDEFAKMYMEEEIDRTEMRDGIFNNGEDIKENANKEDLDIDKNTGEIIDGDFTESEDQDGKTKDTDTRKPKQVFMDTLSELAEKTGTRKYADVLKELKIKNINTVKAKDYEKVISAMTTAAYPKDEKEETAPDPVFLTCPPEINSNQPKTPLGECDKCRNNKNCDPYAEHMSNQPVDEPDGPGY